MTLTFAQLKENFPDVAEKLRLEAEAEAFCLMLTETSLNLDDLLFFVGRDGGIVLIDGLPDDDFRPFVVYDPELGWTDSEMLHDSIIGPLDAWQARNF
jgi:hypothetical protein